MRELYNVIKSVDLKNMEDEENVNLLMENIMIVLKWIY